MTYHTTVLLHEGVDALNVRPNGVYVDATFGGGGHSKLILEQLVKGKLFAFDQDEDASVNAPNDPRFTLVKSNFRFLKNFLEAYGINDVDGILADLGVSGYQFDEAERGFSFRFDAELDMRMNKSQSLTAEILLNERDESNLKRIFKEFGETSFAGALARRIVQQRKDRPFKRIQDLVALIESLIPAHIVKGELPKIFQALRIDVNDELGALKDFLKASSEVLKPEGKLVVISYHSLEDRPVKHFMRSGNFEDKLDKDIYGNINRPLDPLGKVIEPSVAEIERNPRARSAKMRIAVKRNGGKSKRT